MQNTVHLLGQDFVVVEEMAQIGEDKKLLRLEDNQFAIVRFNKKKGYTKGLLFTREAIEDILSADF